MKAIQITVYHVDREAIIATVTIAVLYQRVAIEVFVNAK